MARSVERSAAGMLGRSCALGLIMLTGVSLFANLVHSAISQHQQTTALDERIAAKEQALREQEAYLERAERRRDFVRSDRGSVSLGRSQGFCWPGERRVMFVDPPLEDRPSVVQ